MYNFSGLIYRIWAVGGMLWIPGIILLLLGKFAPNIFKNKREFYITSLMAIIVGLGVSIFFLIKIFTPTIEIHRGIYLEKYRNSRIAPPLPLTMEYHFLNEEGQKKSFYLDALSEKKIIPEGLTEGYVYEIYYEKSTKIIVRVESID